MPDEKLYRPKAAAEYLLAKCGLGAERSLAKWRVLGGGPAFRRMGRSVVYEQSSLDAWIAARLSSPMASTSDTCKAA